MANGRQDPPARLAVYNAAGKADVCFSPGPDGPALLVHSGFRTLKTPEFRGPAPESIKP